MPSSNRRFICAALGAIFIGGLLTPASAADLFKASSMPVPKAAQPAKSDKRIKRVRLLQLDSKVLATELLPQSSDLAADRAQRSRRLGGQVTLKLFDDVVINLRRSEVSEGFDGGVVWHGDAGKGGYGVLVVRNGRISGSIEANRSHYLIESLDGGTTHLVKEIDTEAYPKDIHLEPPKGKTLKKGAVEAPTTRTITYATLMVAVTSRAKTMLGLTYADKIKVDIGLVNQGLRNSRVPLRFRLVGIRSVLSSYNELASTNAVQPLYDVTFENISNFSELRSTRTSLHADLVTMYSVRPEYCGIAWVGDPLYAEIAFSVINASCQGSITLAHEMGHNMGLLHDRYVHPTAPNSVFNYGYVDTIGAFRTIMSYPDKCQAAGVYCTGVTYYSNPRLTYAGRPLGIPAGQPGAADAARKLKINRLGVAAFR